MWPKNLASPGSEQTLAKLAVRAVAAAVKETKCGLT
jgi:hypothetical protein